jgi:hypothetical protein
VRAVFLALPITAEDYLREREVLFRTLMPTAQAMPGARELTAALAPEACRWRWRPARRSPSTS